MTPHLTSAPRAYGLLDTAADWVLDRHGDLYGDEQERLRQYEGLALAATVQGVLVPWLAVLALALWGRPVVPAIILVLVGICLPRALAVSHATRWRVRTLPYRRSRRRLLLDAASGVPCLIALLQIVVALHRPISGAVVGAVIGVGIAFFARIGRRERERARDLAPDDLG